MISESRMSSLREVGGSCLAGQRFPLLRFEKQRDSGRTRKKTEGFYGFKIDAGEKDRGGVKEL